MTDTIVTESISANLDFEYQYVNGQVEGLFIPNQYGATSTIDISGTLDLEYNAGHTLIGVSDVDITISGGGLPTEILTSGTVDTAYTSGGLTIDELHLSGGVEVNNQPAVYSDLYLDFNATTSAGFEDSYNYPEPYTHLATSFASFYDSSVDGEGSITEIPCFTAGTQVMTPGGEVAVETLKIGDLVTLSDGRVAQMTWLGVKTIAMRFADPVRALPIRIKANALGHGLPKRDLLVSPDHALLVDGLLVHAGALVNDVSILRERNVPDVFCYYHVEVEDHSLVLAEGVAAETFVDNVDRMNFDNWAEHEALYGHLPGIREMTYPRAKSVRQVPAALRNRLLNRAIELYGIRAAA